MGLAPAAACRVQAPAIVTDDTQVTEWFLTPPFDNVLPVSTRRGFGLGIFHSRTRSGTPRLLRWAGRTRALHGAALRSRFLSLIPKRELARFDLAQHVTRQSLNAAETHLFVAFRGGRSSMTNHHPRGFVIVQKPVGEIRNV
jgi:hypothetical protein